MAKYADFVKAVAANSGMSIANTKKVMDALKAEITKELTAADGNGSVRIPDVGTFSVAKKNERTYTSKMCPNGVTVPTHYAVKFSPSKALKDAALTVKVK